MHGSPCHHIVVAWKVPSCKIIYGQCLVTYDTHTRTMKFQFRFQIMHTATPTHSLHSLTHSLTHTHTHTHTHPHTLACTHVHVCTCTCTCTHTCRSVACLCVCSGGHLHGGHMLHKHTPVSFVQNNLTQLGEKKWSSKEREREREMKGKYKHTYRLVLLMTTYPVGRHIGTHGWRGPWVHDGWLAHVQLHLCIDTCTCTCE